MKNVLILVIVHKMLIAHHEITEEYVIVALVLQAIHMDLLVLQVRFLGRKLLTLYYIWAA